MVKSKVKFEDCKNCGDNINALVERFTGELLGEFTLEQALSKVKENNKKLEEYKKSLFQSEEVKA